MKKRSITIHGHPTSISIEDEFWFALIQIAKEQGLSCGTLIGRIDDHRGRDNLSSAIRLHILKHLQKKITHDTYLPSQRETAGQRETDKKRTS